VVAQPLADRQAILASRAIARGKQENGDATQFRDNWATNGADIVRLWPDTELQVVDGAVTPYLAIELEPVGSPPNLLASVGSAVLFEADGDDLVPVSGPTTMAPTFLSARYSGDSLGLVLPLAADHDYTVDSAAINLVGAAGTWDASNNWTVSLTSRSASLGVDTVLATGTFSTSGSGTVNLSPAAEVDSEDTPALAIAFEKAGEPPMLLAADATVSLQSTQRVITSYSYDANGNTLSESSAARAVAYTWNGEDRLRAVVDEGSSEQYTYAATGLRRTKTNSSGATSFVWDGQNLFAELDEALATVAQYTDWPGHWGGLSSARRSGGSEWLTYDLSANTRLLLSTAAGVQAAYAYRAFGPELNGAAASNPFRFGGMVGYYGVGAERVYVRARYYETPYGRWSSRDPLRFDRWHGCYMYVRNRPTHLFDPSGLSSIHWDHKYGLAYTHAWIEFDPPCDGMTSIGFWPTRSDFPRDEDNLIRPMIYPDPGVGVRPPIIWNPDREGPIHWGEPGIFARPDPNEFKQPLWSEVWNLNFAESELLCECVKKAVRSKPPDFDLWPVYVCGSWANDMYRCATAGRPPIGPPGGPIMPPLPPFPWTSVPFPVL